MNLYIYLPKKTVYTIFLDKECIFNKPENHKKVVYLSKGIHNIFIEDQMKISIFQHMILDLLNTINLNRENYNDVNIEFSLLSDENITINIEYGVDKEVKVVADDMLEEVINNIQISNILGDNEQKSKKAGLINKVILTVAVAILFIAITISLFINSQSPVWGKCVMSILSIFLIILSGSSVRKLMH